MPRMLAFKLGGKSKLPPAAEFKQPKLTPPRATASLATVKKGEQLFQQYCSNCHGDVAVSGGVLPDLRYSSVLAGQQWLNIVTGGALKAYGMVGFSKELSREDAEAVRAYVIFRANESLAESNIPIKP
jgi:quinohemoprotein ethanol dehydrogenase